MQARLCLDMPISAAGHGANIALRLVGKRTVKKPASSCTQFEDSTVPFEDDEAWHKSNMSGVANCCRGIWSMAMGRGCSKLVLKKWVSATGRGGNKLREQQGFKYRLQSMR